MLTYVISTLGNDTVQEIYFYRTASDEVEVTRRFGELFAILRKEDRNLINYQVKEMKLPFFINDRAIPVENFWPISFAG